MTKTSRLWSRANRKARANAASVEGSAHKRAGPPTRRVVCLESGSYNRAVPSAPSCFCKVSSNDTSSARRAPTSWMLPAPRLSNRSPGASVEPTRAASRLNDRFEHPAPVTLAGSWRPRSTGRSPRRWAVRSPRTPRKQRRGPRAGTPGRTARSGPWCACNDAAGTPPSRGPRGQLRAVASVASISLG